MDVLECVIGIAAFEIAAFTSPGVFGSSVDCVLEAQVKSQLDELSLPNGWIAPNSCNIARITQTMS